MNLFIETHINKHTGDSNWGHMYCMRGMYVGITTYIYRTCALKLQDNSSIPTYKPMYCCLSTNRPNVVVVQLQNGRGIVNRVPLTPHYNLLVLF